MMDKSNNSGEFVAELNNTLLHHFPEFRERLEEEQRLFGGDLVPSHWAYGLVLGPFIDTALAKDDSRDLSRVFRLLEELLGRHDQYVDDLVRDSILEGRERTILECAACRGLIDDSIRKILVRAE